MAIQRAQRHAVTSAELTSSHPARPIQTCQPLYLYSAPSTNHHSRLSAPKQSSSQILSSKKCALLGRVQSMPIVKVAPRDLLPLRMPFPQEDVHFVEIRHADSVT